MISYHRSRQSTVQSTKTFLERNNYWTSTSSTPYLKGNKLRRHFINTFNAQSTLVINMIPGCTALGPVKSLATFS